MFKLSALLSSKKLSKPQVYDTCEACLMSIFIDCVVTGDVSLVGGIEAWEKLYSEFSEISGNSTANNGLRLAIDIAYYTNRIKNIYFIVNYLNGRRVEGLVKELQKMGFNLAFTDLRNDLQRVLTRVKTDELRLSSAISKYNALSSGKEATKLDWLRRLAQLAKYQGVATINAALITVMDFVALEKEFKEYVKAQK